MTGDSELEGGGRGRLNFLRSPYFHSLRLGKNGAVRGKLFTVGGLFLLSQGIIFPSARLKLDLLV